MGLDKLTSDIENQFVRVIDISHSYQSFENYSDGRNHLHITVHSERLHYKLSAREVGILKLLHEDRFEDICETSLNPDRSYSSYSHL